MSSEEQNIDNENKEKK